MEYEDDIEIEDLIIVEEEEDSLFKKLKQLKGEMFYSLFRDHGIDENNLKFVSKSHLDEIMPKGQFGQRLVFENCLSKWQQQMVHQESNTARPKEPQVNSLDLINFFGNDNIVGEILNKSMKGKHVLKFYENNNVLDFTFRNELTNCIVEYLLETKVFTSPRLFERLAYSVSKKFPSESKDIYFIHKKGRKPGGKLYSKYHNSLGKLRKAGLWSHKNPQKRNRNEYEEENEIVDELYSQDDDCQIYKDWLKFNIEPFDKVLDSWKRSFNMRHNFIKERNTLTSIIEEWPILKQSFGYKLISHDFSKLYPTKENLLFDKWESMCTSIIKLFTKILKDEESVLLLQQLDDPNTNFENRNSIILYLLPSLLKPSNKKSVINGNLKKRKYIKTTVQDSRETFTLWALNASELQSKIKNTIDYYFKNKQTLQPIICGIGQSHTNFNELFVYYGNIFYKVANHVLALDTCFKLFNVLDLKYPDSCKNVWLFLQQHIYEIVVDDSEKTPILVTILNDIKFN
ncbi:uncharacterized protein LOC142229060 [Haematobia irritans]|uniref:uncharacterized protein LOC142222153 n=1 Tax=Haematobia irritans TaxID=7368 RepID=UPI003F4F45C2